MPITSHWQTISPPHKEEEAGLTYLAQNLPGGNDYHAWSNFEFIDRSGRIYEVDLLLMTPAGLFLIELKNYRGRVHGTTYTWIAEADDKTPPLVVDNPLLSANRKARALASLLKSTTRHPIPFIKALVFLCGPDVRIELDAVMDVYRRDQTNRPGILHAVRHLDPRARPLDQTRMRTVLQAMRKLDIQPPARRRADAAATHRVLGDYRLDTLLNETDTYQDHLAVHLTLGEIRHRLRLFSDRDADDAGRTRLQDAVKREYRLLHGMDHPGILKPLTVGVSALGPYLTYECRPDESTLDLYLAARGDRLQDHTRLHLVRALVEVLAYCHEHGLTHRNLNPRAVMVLDPESDHPFVKISGWHAGARPQGTRTPTSLLDHLVETRDALYRAPEACNDLPEGDRRGAAMDVFSLGCLCRLIFLGTPPAADLAARDLQLAEGGLLVCAGHDHIPTELEDIIFQATNPTPDLRPLTADLPAMLDLLEEALTRPRTVEPLSAGAGDMLEGGWTVKNRLGRGATAVVFLAVHPSGRELVLKIAADKSHNARLAAEAEALRRLRSPYVVTCEGTVEIKGHTTLLLSPCNRTLGAYLAEQGRLPRAHLNALGTHLLSALETLDLMGIGHRDLKPENIGIRDTPRGPVLQLFDFSLADAPGDVLDLGTPAYRDPFLGRGKRTRWDAHAEAYAAALLLHLMAAGSLPRHPGDTAPSVAPVAARPDGAAFEPALRAPLEAFFHKALHADAAARFADPRGMRHAWETIFCTEAAEPAPAAPEPVSDQAPPPLPPDLDRDSPVAAYLAPALHPVLADLAVHTVGDLVAVPRERLTALPGLGRKLRRALLTSAAVLARRFPAERLPDGPAPGLDALVAKLLPKAETDREVLSLLLGLDQRTQPLPRTLNRRWPTAADLVRHSGIARARVEQVLQEANLRWRKSGEALSLLKRLRDQVAEALQGAGGLLDTESLYEVMLQRNGCRQEGVVRYRYAHACLRAACLVESYGAPPRWLEHRGGDTLLLALDVPGDPSEEPGAASRCDAAERLGRVADRLAADRPPARPAQVLRALKLAAEQPGPDGHAPLTALTPEQRLHLAACCARRAALSAAGEFYPHDMEPAQTLSLARGTLLGLTALTEERLHRRVVSRYPKAAPLPRGEALAALLCELNLPCVWDPTLEDHRGGVVFGPPGSLHGYGSSHPGSYHPTDDHGPGPAGEAAAFDRLLTRVCQEAGFVILGAGGGTGHARALARLRRLPVTPLDGDRLLLDALRAVCTRRGIPWDTVLTADAQPADSAGRRNLLERVVAPARELVAARFAGSGPVLLYHLGLFARYGLLDLVPVLRDRCGRPDGPAGLLLLLPAARPHVDGTPLPVVTPGQWAAVPPSWIQPTEVAS